MVIQNAIVHEAVKAQGSRNVQLKLRDSELPLSTQVTQLATLVRDLYQDRTGRAYGQLRGGGEFTGALVELEENSVDFTQWSLKAMNALKASLEVTPPATGGHMFFLRYAVNGTRYLFIAMLKHTDGISFSDSLEILEVKHLDLEKLHLAARIDMDKWLTPGAERYVSFVKGRANREIRDYFVSFLSVEELDDSSKQTGSLVRALTQYCAGFADADVASDAKDRALDYGRRQAESGEPLDLAALSRLVNPEEPDGFLAFATDEVYAVPGEFMVDTKKLDGLRIIRGGDSQLRISFQKELLQRRVHYNSEGNTLTIQDVPANLRAQLSPTEE